MLEKGTAMNILEIVYLKCDQHLYDIDLLFHERTIFYVWPTACGPYDRPVLCLKQHVEFGHIPVSS